MRTVLAFALMAATAAMQPTSLSAQEPVRPAVEMTPGDVLVFRSPRNIANIVVGDVEVAGVTILDPLNFYIVAKNAGDTSIVLLDRDNQVIFTTALDVIPEVLDEVVVLPEAPVKVAAPPRTFVVQSHSQIEELDVARVYECGPPGSVGRVCSPGPVRVLDHYAGQDEGDDEADETDTDAATENAADTGRATGGTRTAQDAVGRSE